MSRPIKILLVNPNRLKPAVAPVALDYLADALHRQGIRSRILDLCFVDDPAPSLAGALALASYDAVGVTVRNTDDVFLASGEFFVPAIADLVKAARSAGAACPIILGGVGFSCFPEAILEITAADYGVVGDGEIALPALLAALRDGRDPGSVPGVVRPGHGSPPTFADLAAYGPSGRGAVDNVRYFQEGGQGSFESSRGCDRTCVYCPEPAVRGRLVRRRDPRAVASEVATLASAGITHLHTCDSEFNADEEHALAVCRAIEQTGSAARWYAYATLPLSERLADAMARAGCAGINFGVDSADPAVLADLGKRYGPEEIARARESCRRAGIAVMFDLLLGGPAETRDTLATTISTMKRLDPECVGVMVGIRLYPGTPLANRILATEPMEANPALRGARVGNASLVRPVFYLNPELGDSIFGILDRLIQGDERFFFSQKTEEAECYNYSQHDTLVRAIGKGARGAYWDILRKTRHSGKPG